MVKKRKLNQAPVSRREERQLLGIGGDDVSNARDRLKGALQDLLEHSDDSSISSQDDDSQVETYSSRHPGKKQLTEQLQIHGARNSRQVRKRRRREIVNEGAYHHTYVMKLFDRSVDLAQFKESTPLYPVCRAWMANQPLNTNLVPKTRSPTPEPPVEEPSEHDGDDSMQNVYKMPPPEPLLYDTNNQVISIRVPSPVQPSSRVVKDMELDCFKDVHLTREALLQQHLAHWTTVRKKWHNISHLNENRYSESGQILKTIFKKALVM